jgi:hypothetical protein
MVSHLFFYQLVLVALGINEMDPPLCGSAVISHNEVRDTDH